MQVASFRSKGRALFRKFVPLVGYIFTIEATIESCEWALNRRVAVSTFVLKPADAIWLDELFTDHRTVPGVVKAGLTIYQKI